MRQLSQPFSVLLPAPFAARLSRHAADDRFACVPGGSPFPIKRSHLRLGDTVTLTVVDNGAGK